MGGRHLTHGHYPYPCPHLKNNCLLFLCWSHTEMTEYCQCFLGIWFFLFLMFCYSKIDSLGVQELLVVLHWPFVEDSFSPRQGNAMEQCLVILPSWEFLLMLICQEHIFGLLSQASLIIQIELCIVHGGRFGQIILVWKLMPFSMKANCSLKKLRLTPEECVQWKVGTSSGTAPWQASNVCFSCLAVIVFQLQYLNILRTSDLFLLLHWHKVSLQSKEIR